MQKLLLVALMSTSLVARAGTLINWWNTGTKVAAGAEEACPRALTSVDTTEQRRQQAAALLKFIGLTQGQLPMSLLEREQGEITFLQTMLLASGFTIPFPPETWGMWGRSRSPIDRSVENLSLTLHAGHRRARGDLAKGDGQWALIERMLGNLKRILNWARQSGSPNQQPLAISFYRGEGSLQRLSLWRVGIVDEVYVERLVELLAPLEDEVVEDFVRQILRHHFLLFVSAHHELVSKMNPRWSSTSQRTARGVSRPEAESLGREIDKAIIWWQPVDPGRPKIETPAEPTRFVARDIDAFVAVERHECDFREIQSDLHRAIDLLNLGLNQIADGSTTEPDWARWRREMKPSTNDLKRLSAELVGHRGHLAKVKAEVVEGEKAFAKLHDWVGARATSLSDFVSTEKNVTDLPTRDQLALNALLQEIPMVVTYVAQASESMSQRARVLESRMSATAHLAMMVGQAQLTALRCASVAPEFETITRSLEDMAAGQKVGDE